MKVTKNLIRRMISEVINEDIGADPETKDLPHVRSIEKLDLRFTDDPGYPYIGEKVIKYEGNTSYHEGGTHPLQQFADPETDKFSDSDDLPPRYIRTFHFKFEENSGIYGPNQDRAENYLVSYDYPFDLEDPSGSQLINAVKGQGDYQDKYVVRIGGPAAAFNPSNSSTANNPYAGALENWSTWSIAPLYDTGFEFDRPNTSDFTGHVHAVLVVDKQPGTFSVMALPGNAILDLENQKPAAAAAAGVPDLDGPHSGGLRREPGNAMNDIGPGRGARDAVIGGLNESTITRWGVLAGIK